MVAPRGSAKIFAIVNETSSSENGSRLPPYARNLIAVTLLVVALVSIHANVERAHRRKIETTIVTPVNLPNM